MISKLSSNMNDLGLKPSWSLICPKRKEYICSNLNHSDVWKRPFSLKVIMKLQIEDPWVRIYNSGSWVCSLNLFLVLYHCIPNPLITERLQAIIGDHSSVVWLSSVAWSLLEGFSSSCRQMAAWAAVIEGSAGLTHSHMLAGGASCQPATQLGHWAKHLR